MKKLIVREVVEELKLKELAKVIRSKNPGPFWITIDIMFDDKNTYEKVKLSGVLNREFIAHLYDIDNERVQFFYYDPAFSFKASIKREIWSGGIGDSDIWGAQQHAVFLDIEVPICNEL